MLCRKVSRRASVPKSNPMVPSAKTYDGVAAGTIVAAVAAAVFWQLQSAELVTPLQLQSAEGAPDPPATAGTADAITPASAISSTLFADPPATAGTADVITPASAVSSTLSAAAAPAGSPELAARTPPSGVPAALRLVCPAATSSA